MRLPRPDKSGLAMTLYEIATHPKRCSQSDCVTITSFTDKENINKNQIKLLFYKTFSHFYAIILT